MYELILNHPTLLNAFLVGRPLVSFIGPLTPLILAQKLFRRLAALGDFAASLAETGGLRLAPSVLLKERRHAVNSPTNLVKLLSFN